MHYPMPLPIATHHPRGCWRCDPLGSVPYGSVPTAHTESTPSCIRLYRGVDDQDHRCNRPAGHEGTHSAADYR